MPSSPDASPSCIPMASAPWVPVQAKPRDYHGWQNCATAGGRADESTQPALQNTDFTKLWYLMYHHKSSIAAINWLKCTLKLHDIIQNTIHVVTWHFNFFHLLFFSDEIVPISLFWSLALEFLSCTSDPCTMAIFSIGGDHFLPCWPLMIVIIEMIRPPYCFFFYGVK